MEADETESNDSSDYYGSGVKGRENRKNGGTLGKAAVEYEPDNKGNQCDNRNHYWDFG